MSEDCKRPTSWCCSACLMSHPLPYTVLACGSMTDLTTQSLMQMGGGAMQKPRRRRRRPSSAESPICKFQDLSKRRGGKAVDYTSRRRKCGEVEQAVVQLSFLPPNASAVPGSKQWVYCSLPLSKDLDKCLAHKWPAVESTYDASMKAIFQLLRREREAMCRYLHRCRYNYYTNTRRPHVMSVCSAIITRPMPLSQEGVL